jgi:hypothetical protein
MAMLNAQVDTIVEIFSRKGAVLPWIYLELRVGMKGGGKHGLYITSEEIMEISEVQVRSKTPRA